MTDPIHDFRIQAQVDTRANLFFFLQSISSPTEEKGRQQGAESPVSDEQLQTHQEQNGLVS
jgi:hypothetical protein